MNMMKKFFLKVNPSHSEDGMYISGIYRIAETPSLRKLLAHR